MNNTTILQKFIQLQEDFLEYCAYNVWIKNVGGILVRLLFNNLQRTLWELFKEDWKNIDGQIKWYLVKMRKGGASTFFITLFYWLTTMFRNKAALIVAHDEDSAKAMINTIQTIHLRSERWLRPKTRTMNRKEIYFANSVEEAEKTGDIGLDSIIDSATIDTKTLARSRTFQYALLTEFGQYPELGLDIDERLVALFNAVPDEPGIKSFIVAESTARGDNAAKDFWYDDTNGFRKIFIGMVAMESYRIPITIDKYFELSEDKDSRYGDELEERKKLIPEIKFWYPNLTTEYEIESEVMARLAWRRKTIDVKCRGSKDKFKQEYPITVQDAFEGSNESIFPIKNILEMEEILKKLKLKSKTYNYNHDDTIKDKTHKFYPSKYGALEIFAYADPDSHYVIGADGAQGIKGGDYSTAYVLKLPNFEEVACFEDIIKPSEFAGVLNYLGLIYNKALVAVEINDPGGFAANEKLMDFYNYPNLYYRINPYEAAAGDMPYGWKTNDQTRPIMIRDFDDDIQNKRIYIKSIKLLTQMKTFVRLKNGKIGASPGKHDDLIIAAMIARQIATQVHIARPVIPNKAPKGSVDWHIQQLGIKVGKRPTMRRGA
jgi:hypothetical protein